jgi:hypothetical protein
MHLGAASSVDAPTFRVITQVLCDLAADSTMLLHDFLQTAAYSGRRCRAPIADLWLLTSIELHRLFFQLLSTHHVPNSRHRPGVSNRDRLIGGQAARFHA